MGTELQKNRMKKLSIEELISLNAPMIPGMVVLGERDFLYDEKGIVIDIWKEQTSKSTYEWQVLVDMLWGRNGWVLRTIPPELVWPIEAPEKIDLFLPSHLVLNSDFRVGLTVNSI